ncbi:uncharacterized protein PV09_06075 [Verruconis gallopava]|uniref:Peptidase A1 domain-containing protein n=1 Tax=Verruconis gallopava TaxID=253628 RepID=A0A0D2A7U2_9PEZI|nr:uncharacterized protein PV09_06075 [Verruconis gallopava]KIW02635.1 hypothetical protein PV09_06075 [Verruconis gallopava]
MLPLARRADSLCWLALSLLALTPSSSCLPGRLRPRATTVPAPISFSPAQNWEGIDGTWNTFALQVGTPAQAVRVMISTASQQQWVIDPRGCPSDASSFSTCASSRGDTFNMSQSTTWDTIGLYELWIEKNLGLYGNANYGYDTVTLGYPGEGGPTLKNQTVGVLATDAFYFGHFGINPKPTNFTNFVDESPSYLTDLKKAGLIPSVSWGYTAGAPYRFAKVYSSLTLGGYDSDRFIPNGISFPFGTDNERDILVSVTSISSVDTSGTQTSLLPNSIYSYIDSTIAEIWLPVEACQQFEKAFNLTYDETTQLYLLSEAEHNAMLVSNPNITITVAPYTLEAAKAGTVNITLPYAAFDQIAKPPYQSIANESRYFPLRRAANDSQYTLGRTFLQEAYLTVDWERSNFSVAACNWANGGPTSQNIVAISSYNDTKANDGNGASPTGSGASSQVSPLRIGAIAGIAVGGVVIILASIVGVLLYLKHKSSQAAKNAKGAEKVTPKTVDSTNSKDDDGAAAADPIAGPTVYPKAELDASTPARTELDTEYYKPGLASSATSSHVALVHESDSKEREVFEMPGDMPTRQEADGRAYTEKEVMRHREERINGTDPGISPITPNSSDRSPASTVATGTLPSSISSRANRMLNPGEIIELGPLENGTQLVSPLGSDGHTMMFTNMAPLTPTTANGSSTNGSTDPDSGTRKRFSYEDP